MDKRIYKMQMTVRTKLFKKMTSFPKGGAKWKVVGEDVAITYVIGESNANRLVSGYDNIVILGEVDSDGNFITQDSTTPKEEVAKVEEVAVTEEPKPVSEVEQPTTEDDAPKTRRKRSTTNED